MSFFSYKDPEILTHEDLNDAVYEYLEETRPDEWERKIFITQYERIIVSEVEKNTLTEGVLENLLEMLDENYGDPETSTKPSANMVLAATTLINTVLSEYHVWKCVRVGDIVVNLVEYLNKYGYEEYRVNRQEEVTQAIKRLKSIS